MRGGTRSGTAPGQRLRAAHRPRLGPSRSPAVPAPLPCSPLTPIGMLGFLQPGTIPPRCHRGSSARPGTSALAARGESAVPPPAPGTAQAAALPLLCSAAGGAPRNKDFRRRRRGDPGLSPPHPRSLPAPAGLARPRPPPAPEPILGVPAAHGPARRTSRCHRRPPPRVSCPAHPTPPPPPCAQRPPPLPCASPRRPGQRTKPTRRSAARRHRSAPLSPHRTTRCSPSPPAPRNLRTLLLAHPSKLSLPARLCCSAPRHLGHRRPGTSSARGSAAAPRAQTLLRCPPRTAPCPGRAFLASRGAPQEEEPLPSGHSWPPAERCAKNNPRDDNIRKCIYFPLIDFTWFNPRKREVESPLP
ncbi:uncharacterized protein LOC141730868 isoform X1 [Zonotrichia albicollis]|uniref:uncharacterized protein LOC141730868 isoform X1 n=1 Tax=Zonotrichia albicollis TaxID=44394 RepID=UPI003D80CF9E